MTEETQIAKIEESAPVTIENVKRYLCPTATDSEVFLFIELCKKRKLNPWIKEAYLIKYGSAQATIVVAYDVFIKRAKRQQDYKGYKAGLILKTDEGSGVSAIKRTEGAFYEPTDKIMGSWCKVFRENKDEHLAEVAFQEYVGKKGDGSINKQWQKMPGTMIIKVAISQAHRLSYPEEFSGMYLEDEMHGVNKFEGVDSMVNVTPKPVLLITQEQADELNQKAAKCDMVDKLLSSLSVESFEEIAATEFDALSEKLNSHIARLEEADK